MSDFSVGRIHLRNKLRRSARRRNPLDAVGIRIGINDGFVASPARSHDSPGLYYFYRRPTRDGNFFEFLRIGTEKCEPLPVRGKERSAVGAFGTRHGFGRGTVQRA